MKKLFALFAVLAMFAFAGCKSFELEGIFGGSHSINGAIQKGPFIEGTSINIQPLDNNLKPTGQMYTTMTINDAGMFELNEIDSKYAEIIATGYYFDEVEGKISESVLTLRSIANLEDGTQTNVNILTTLTYKRIKHLVTSEGKDISEAQSQAERELFTTLGIPVELQPNVSCGAMNIANNGDGDGLLLALSAILQEGRSVGELSEYISKFATDLSDDGAVSETLLEKFNLDGQHLLRFEERIKENLIVRYESLGVQCVIPDFSQYLPYLTSGEPYFIIPFTYKEVSTSDTEYNGIEKLSFSAYVPVPAESGCGIVDVFVGYAYHKGVGEIYLSKAPTETISCECDVLLSIEIPEGVTSISSFRCKSLRSILLPNSLTKIYATTFNKCYNLQSIVIPDSVTSIEWAAFSESGLCSVIIGSGVAEIGYNAFNCDNLESVYCKPSVPPALGDYKVFRRRNDEPICFYVPDESVETYKSAWFLHDHNVVGYNFTEGNEASLRPSPNEIWYTTTNGEKLSSYYYNADPGACGASHMKDTYEDGKGVITFDCPITSLRHGIFDHRSSLESVTIPDSVTSIGGYAFNNCSSLTSITIPDRVTEIGYGAFSDCSSLTEVYCKPTTPPNGNSLMFSSNPSSRKIYVPTESVEAYKDAEYWSEYADSIVGYDFE